MLQPQAVETLIGRIRVNPFHLVDRAMLVMIGFRGGRGGKQSKETYGQQQKAQAQAHRSLSERRRQHQSSHWGIVHSRRQACRSPQAGA